MSDSEAHFDRTPDGAATGLRTPAECLAEANAAVAARKPLREALSLICEALVASGSFDRAGVMLYDAERDVLSDAPASDADGPAELGQAASAEMRVGDERLGLLWADNARTGRDFSKADLATLSLWAQVSAGLVHSANLLHEQDRRVRGLQRLTELSAAVAAGTDLDALLGMVRTAIMEVGYLDRVGVYTFNPERNVLEGVWGTTRDGGLEDIRGQTLDPSGDPDTPIYRVLHGELAYVLAADLTSARQLTPEHSMYGVHAHCAVPMRAGTKPVGVIVGDNLLTDRPITDDDIAFLLPHCELAAVAVVTARLHADLTAARDGLEVEVRRRISEAEALNAEMEAIVRTISHDLRSPVRAVEGFTYSLMETVGSSLPPDARRDMERVRTAIDRMGRLIEALLAIGRLGRRKPHTSLVQPNRLALQVLADIRAEHRHGAEVNVLPMPGMHADVEMMRLLYRELIDNALKATRDVTLAMIEIGHADGAYYVRDNGVGFEQEYAHTLFDLFRRYDHEADTTGAGLTIARRIVSIHGGSIWAEGRTGEGATFYFTVGTPSPTPAPTSHTVVTHGPAGQEDRT